MRTLVQAFKSAKDNNRRTGASPRRAPFMNELEEIFGREPIINNCHTLNLGTTVQTALSEDSRKSFGKIFFFSNSVTRIFTLTFLQLADFEASSCSANEQMFEEYLEDTFSPTTTNVSSSNASNEDVVVVEKQQSTVTPTTISNQRKRKSPKQKYYEDKLELKKKFYDNITELVKERNKNMEAVEKQKVVLLKEALDQKKQD